MPQIDKGFRFDIIGWSQPGSSRSPANSTESAEIMTIGQIVNTQAAIGPSLHDGSTFRHGIRA